MNDQELQDMLKQAKHDISLDETDKNRRKEAFRRFMRDNAPAEPVRWWQRLTSVRIFLSPVPYASAFLVILLVGGSVSYAAQDALPGDPLYPVKVSINEEVQSYLYHSSPESHAMYEARRAGQRLQEIEELATRGKVDVNNFSQMSHNLETHIADIKKYIQSKKQATPETEKATSTTRATSTPPVATSGASEDAAADASIKNASSSAGTSTNRQDISFEAAGSSTPAVDASSRTATGSPDRAIIDKTKRSKRDIQQIREHISGTTTSLAAEKKKSVMKRLRTASNAFATGLHHLQKQRYDQALKHLTKSQRIVREIKQFLRKHSDAARSTFASPLTGSSTPTATSTQTTHTASSTATSTRADQRAATTSQLNQHPKE